MKIRFVDTDKKFITEIEKQLINNKLNLLFSLTAECTDIRKVEENNKVVYVSPANSYGFMDGGIDAIFSRMFSGIQKTVQTKISEGKYRDNLDRPFLPIGDAIIVETGIKNKLLICAPTMFRPEPVKKSNNAYLAFKAILVRVLEYNMKEKEQIKTIICCGLCTLTGRMDAKESVRQIKKALVEFHQQDYTLIMKTNP